MEDGETGQNSIHAQCHVMVRTIVEHGSVIIQNLNIMGLTVLSMDLWERKQKAVIRICAQVRMFHKDKHCCSLTNSL